MFRLTREVRFAINPDRYDSAAPVTNGYAGFPTLRGIAPYLALQVSLSGELDPQTQYLLNIKRIDAVVRERAIALIHDWLEESSAHDPCAMIAFLFGRLAASWPGATLESLRLMLSPFLSVSCSASESHMVCLSQKFEFSASHRLHSAVLSEAENQACYGKCNNPHGHGHNYEVQVTLRGRPRENGLLIDIPVFEEIVSQTVIQKLDHKNLNIEVAEFKELVPSVENIAKVIYRLLKPRFMSADATLAGVTVWETPKTWCEYQE